MATKIETRAVCGELRAEGGADDFILTGYSALFNTLSSDLGGFKEKISPGAFDNSLRSGADVKFTFNHSEDAILARRNAGSLQLDCDQKGLRFRAQLNRNMQSHRDLWEAVRTGLYHEASFAFTVPPGGDSWSPDGHQRTLNNVNLLDCSLVGSPAYPGTSAAARSEDAAGDGARRRRFEALQADWKRRERANTVLSRIAAETRAAEDDPDDDNPENELDDLLDRAAAALQEQCEGYRFLGATRKHVYAIDRAGECHRWSYEVDSAGNIKVDNDSRQKMMADVAGKRWYAAAQSWRERRAGLQEHMRALAGLR